MKTNHGRTAAIAAIALMAAANLRAVTVSYEATSLGLDLFQIDYIVSGIQFQMNQELDIRFDPALFETLSNGSAGPGFDVLLLQPGNPPGAFGDYSAMALVNSPSLSSVFRVNVRYHGGGSPGAQPFAINQFDANGRFVSVVGSGNTQSQSPSSFAPEPRSLFFTFAGLLFCFVLGHAVRRQANGAHGRVRPGPS
jgi:hypothetical protein